MNAIAHLTEQRLKEMAWGRIFEVLDWGALNRSDLRITKVQLVDELIRFARTVREEEDALREEDGQQGIQSKRRYRSSRKSVRTT